MQEKREREFTTHVELLLLSEPISQYSSKNLPETDDNDGTHKNDANMLSWHMVNAYFWTSALKEAIQVTCLGFLKTLFCASSNNAL